MMYSCSPSSSSHSSSIVKKRGKSLRVDIHCHYLNREVAAKVTHLDPGRHEPSVVYANALTRETNVKQMKDRAPKLSDIALRLKDMDAMGIDVQAVSPAPNQTYYWTDPGLGAELARCVNERIAEIVAQHPDRFIGLGTVPLQDADLAVSELNFLVKNLGLRGVEINPSVNGLDLSDQRLYLDRFFARVQELDVIVFMHPIGFTQGERLVDHYFNNVIGNPPGDDGGGEPPHLRRRARASPEAEDRAAACRRLPCPLLGAHGPRLASPSGLQSCYFEETKQLSREVLLRHHHFRSWDAFPPDRALRRRPRAPRHRLPLRHGRRGSRGVH